MQYFQFSIEKIEIDSIGNSSSLNIGRNLLNEFDSMAKTNQGLGKISGNENKLPKTTNTVEDSDEKDATNKK